MVSLGIVRDLLCYCSTWSSCAGDRSQIYQRIMVSVAWWKRMDGTIIQRCHASMRNQVSCNLRSRNHSLVILILGIPMKYHLVLSIVPLKTPNVSAAPELDVHGRYSRIITRKHTRCPTLLFSEVLACSRVYSSVWRSQRCTRPIQHIHYASSMIHNLEAQMFSSFAMRITYEMPMCEIGGYTRRKLIRRFV